MLTFIYCEKPKIWHCMEQLPIFDEEEQELKRYYSISEIAVMFKVSPSLIRHWEKEFDLLKPHKGSKGDRKFTPQNIEQFRTIFHLVKERGFTLEGAKQELRHQREWQKEKQEWLSRFQHLKHFLEQLRDDL